MTLNKYLPSSEISSQFRNIKIKIQQIFKKLHKEKVIE